jgi:transcriptional regulator with XRE-family HTH domain
MEISTRIHLVIKLTNHTAASFADVLQVNRSTLSHILNGRNKPGLDFLEKVLITFPKVDARWLLTGEQPTATKFHEEPSPTPTPVAASELFQKSESVKEDVSEIERIVVFYRNNKFKEYRQA